MKICVIDDDDNYLEIIRKVLLRYFDQAMIISYNSYNDIIEKCDIYFIDIDLREDNGIEISKKIIKKYPRSKLIFVSAHNDLVYNALSVQPFYFIRKDHLEEDFYICVELLNELNKEQFHSFKLNNGLTKKINVYNIVYIEVISHHIYIYENVDQAYIVYMTLKEFMDEVNLKYIVQIHKSYLVNLLYVEKIEGQICYLKGGVALTLGRKYKNEFIERYEELM